MAFSILILLSSRGLEKALDVAIEDRTYAVLEGHMGFGLTNQS